MQEFNINKGETSKILTVFLQDSASATGAGLTAKVYSDFTVYWFAENSTAATAITTASQTTLGTWVSGGIKKIDDTNMPGWYSFCLPDTVLTRSANRNWVALTMTVTGALTINITLWLGQHKDFLSLAGGTKMIAEGKTWTYRNEADTADAIVRVQTASGNQTIITPTIS